MEVQSLSIDVPSGCLNNCWFCVSQMHRNDYEHKIIEAMNNDKLIFQDESKFYIEEYKKRMQFARDNGCNTIMLTGTGEPLMNKKFLKRFSKWNGELKNPFLWIELQTSGVGLDDDYCKFLRNEVGVNTISLSLCDIFNSDINTTYVQTKPGHAIDIFKICEMIKKWGFNLRISLNMTERFNDIDVDQIFDQLEALGADQVTFRELYQSGDPELKQNKWIERNAAKYEVFHNINKYIKEHGIPLEILPFGARKYSVREMSVVIDDDCMSKQSEKVLKYLILRPNCKLYSRWDDKGSLYF